MEALVCSVKMGDKPNAVWKTSDFVVVVNKDNKSQSASQHGTLQQIPLHCVCAFEKLSYSPYTELNLSKKITLLQPKAEKR